MSNMSSAKNDRPVPALPAKSNLPSGIDRRSFLMRNAVIGAAAVMTGTAGRPKRGPNRPRRKPRRRRWVPRCPPI